MNLSKQSGDKELFSGERSSKENTEKNCNVNGNSSLFSETLVKDNTMNLSEQSIYPDIQLNENNDDDIVFI